jgi:hypothetical protein
MWRRWVVLEKSGDMYVEDQQSLPASSGGSGLSKPPRQSGGAIDPIKHSILPPEEHTRPGNPVFTK